MNVSHLGLLVVSMLVAMPVHPAASDRCREEDLDAQGKCPKPPPSRGSPVKATQLDIQGADITGGQVSLDGKVAGHAPLTVSTTPGRHRVEVKRDNYASYSAWIDVKNGERKLVQVKLQPVTPGTVGRQTAADRGGVGIRGAWHRRPRVSMGERSPGRKEDER